MMEPHRSQASRDLAAYIEKRDAALARARQLRLLKQMGADERPDEPPPRPKPIQTLTASHDDPKIGDLYSRLNELEHSHRALKSDHSRLQQTVQKLSRKIALLEQQPPLKAATPSSPSSSFSAEGVEPSLPSSRRRSSSGRRRHSSPPPMDFTLDPPDHEPPPGFTTPTRVVRHHVRPSATPPAASHPVIAVTFDELPISPAGGEQSKMSEQNDRPEPLFPCKTCGRRFRAGSLAKHAANCVKVFQTKRKEFKVEVLNDDDVQELRRVYRPPPPQSMKKAAPKWRQDRAKLRQTLLAGSGGPKDVVVEDTRVTCPHCSRRFGESAAERHIPKCQHVVHKPAMLFRKPPTRF